MKATAQRLDRVDGIEWYLVEFDDGSDSHVGYASASYCIIGRDMQPLDPCVPANLAALIVVRRAELARLLKEAYATLFVADPQYAYAAAKNTPEQLAEKMLAAFVGGTGSIEGEGINRACKGLKIKRTYKSIEAFIAGNPMTTHATK